MSNTCNRCKAHAMSGTTRYSLARAAPAPRHAPACCSTFLTPHHALDTQQMRCQCPAHRSARACACARQSAHRQQTLKLGACTSRVLLNSILGVRPIFLDEENRREPLSKKSAITQPATKRVSSSLRQLLKINIRRSSSIRPDHSNSQQLCVGAPRAHPMQEQPPGARACMMHSRMHSMRPCIPTHKNA